MTLEKEIENSILNYLDFLPNCFAWKNQNVGIYDARKRTYRKSNSKHQFKGISDILGIYKGKMLAIEVKQPKKKPTEDQQKFINKINENGGIAFVATCINDVEVYLGTANRNDH